MTELPRSDLDRIAIYNALDRRVADLNRSPGGHLGARRVQLSRLTPRDTVRAAAPSGGRPSGGGPADPVAAAVVDPTEILARLARWDQMLVDALALLDQLAAETGEVLHSAAATRADPPRQLEAKGCRSCARVPSATDPTKPYFVEIDTDRYRDYCRYCGRIKAETGRVPPRGVIAYRRDHGKDTVPSSVWDAALAAEGLPPRARR